MTDGPSARDDAADGSQERVVRTELAIALAVLAGSSGLLALAVTGHDRVVAVAALATLLLAVLDAAARALTST